MVDLGDGRAPVSCLDGGKRRLDPAKSPTQRPLFLQSSRLHGAHHLGHGDESGVRYRADSPEKFRPFCHCPLVEILVRPNLSLYAPSSLFCVFDEQGSNYPYTCSQTNYMDTPRQACPPL
jgi:hypothetical protein